MNLDDADVDTISAPPAGSSTLPPPSFILADTTPTHSTPNNVDPSADDMALDPPLPAAAPDSAQDETQRFTRKKKGKEPVRSQPERKRGRKLEN
jgi:hypothetical protein